MPAALEKPKGKTLRVVPIHKGNWDMCYQHKNLLENFLSFAGYEEEESFDMAQRRSFDLPKEDNNKNADIPIKKGIIMSVEVKEETHSHKCLVTFCVDEVTCWPYVFSHSKYSANEIHKMVLEAMGGKEKIHLAH